MKILGANKITVSNQLDIISYKVSCHQHDIKIDSEFSATFKKIKPAMTDVIDVAEAPFLSLGAYIDFALFDNEHGYYTNNVKIGLSGNIDFTTQLHNGLGFVFGILVQAYNVWLTQVRTGIREKTDTFNIVEPGAGYGIFAVKLLTILDNLDLLSLDDANKANWLLFTAQLRLHLSDRSPFQVQNIKNALEDIRAELHDKTLLDKVSVDCCSLSEINIPADFLLIQEVFDVLPIERIKFSDHGIKVAIVIPTTKNEVDDKPLRDWLEQHSELKKDELTDRFVLSNLSKQELSDITFLETYVDIGHFPEIKKQVMQFFEYYDTLAAKEKSRTINIRRQLTPSFVPFTHLRGVALVLDYGHTCHDIETVEGHRFHELRLYPQDNANSYYVRTDFSKLFSHKKFPRKNAHLLNPGKYDITANVDFSELLHHLSDQHAPVCYGPQSITSTSHFIDILQLMPAFTSDYLENTYLPAYQEECDKFSVPKFELESPFVVTLRLFTDYIGASALFKQLIVANTAFAAELHGHYKIEFNLDSNFELSRHPAKNTI